ncbi:TENX-like protein, partial [Mya arenaria]
CTCENEYKFQDGSCVHSICPANCSTCTSSDNCTFCVDEYYYGDTCEHECSNCRSGTTCMKSDGYCRDECADGFSGDYCGTPCNNGCATCTRYQTYECLSCQTGRHGHDGSYYTCRNTCNNTCVNMSCDVLNGQCDQGCVDGYSGPFCNISCPTNCKSCHQYNGECDFCSKDFWGKKCLNNCSENCTHINESLSSCDITSGECKHGCQNGTHGSFCNIKCDQKCLASGDGVRECRQTDGQCTQGCITGRRKDSTDNPKTGGYEADLVISKEENGAVFQNATASTSIYHVINDTTENVKPGNGFENNPIAARDENNADRSSDCQDKIVITKASTGQSKTKKLRNSAGRSEQLENSVEGQTPIKDASNDITHNKDTGDVYYNMNKVAVKDLGLFVATKDNAYFLEEFKKLPEGPTEKTMQDYSVFWRMIWQQKVGKIVMLTNLVEDGDKEDRAVQHLHFTSWPDKGVPDDVTSLVDFRHRVLQ